MAKVTFEKAQRWYPGADTPAVPGIDLEIGDGEFMVLVGPSGCGKSTTLRMLAGLEDVNEGHIYIGDRDVTHIPPKDRDIAMVFQNYALYPHMTVADNMAFALKMAKVNKDEQKKRVAEAARILGLEEYLERKPKALSGGQRQRVAMGRAIVREPQVFLMDEPLSNLDAKLRVSTRSQIAALQRRLGITTIYVTHDQVEAMTMGDRVAVLNGGVLQQVDIPRRLSGDESHQGPRCARRCALRRPRCPTGPRDIRANRPQPRGHPRHTSGIHPRNNARRCRAPRSCRASRRTWRGCIPLRHSRPGTGSPNGHRRPHRPPVHAGHEYHGAADGGQQT